MFILMEISNILLSGAYCCIIIPSCLVFINVYMSFFKVFFKSSFIVIFFSSFFFDKFIYLFLAVLGLHCCTRAFSSCEQGLLFVAVRRLLIAVASLVAEHGL